MKKKPFAKWWADLKRLAHKYNWPINEAEPESYREAWDDDLSPEDMLHEEMDAAR